MHSRDWVVEVFCLSFFRMRIWRLQFLPIGSVDSAVDCSKASERCSITTLRFVRLVMEYVLRLEGSGTVLRAEGTVRSSRRGHPHGHCAPEPEITMFNVITSLNLDMLRKSSIRNLIPTSSK